MKRQLLVILVLIGLLSGVIASGEPRLALDELSKDCYTSIGPVLQHADGRLTADVCNAYMNWAEKTIIAELQRSSQTVPASWLAEVRQDTNLRVAVFGSVFPPDPSILQNYAQLRTQLGEDFLAKYGSFAIAIAVSRRIKGVESAAQGKEIGRDYQDGFWVDESLHTPGSNEEKLFVRCAANFMSESHVSAFDLYQNSALQDQFKAYLAKHGVAANWVSEVKKSVPFGEWLKNAMVLLNQRPGVRDTKPNIVAWMRHLVEINETTPASTPDNNGKPMPWPLFPIASAPWPLLMPLAHSVPLSEADYIWETFQGEHGPDRYHTYGPYYGDDDVISHSLMPSKWFWDAWPDRIIHGGECVPISKGTVDLYSALGKPAMWAGQPGHANLISFQFVNGRWTAEIEQAFAGGPDVTSAQWYFDEDPGTEIRFRDLYYWPGAEYHLGLALGMQAGMDSYLNTRIAANIFRVLPQDEKRTLGLKLLRNALGLNPFNPEIWYRLATEAPDMKTELAVSKAAESGEIGLIAESTAGAGQDLHGTGTARAQYWHTLAQFVPQIALLQHPVPVKIEDMRSTFNVLKAAPGVSAADLAAYAEKYLANPADPGADNPTYDEGLAAEGDDYGQLRMGQRYRDGDGVPQSVAKANEFLARAARQGDEAAAVILANMSPTIPGDMIKVTASSEFSTDQLARHLVDGSGMMGAFHDNEGAAKTMWHTPGHPGLAPPSRGLPASPAWVRFDFVQPMKFDSTLIWNHNQDKLTDRGFRSTRVYGSLDGIKWTSLTGAKGTILSQASGEPNSLPESISNSAADQPFKSVIFAADSQDGNYGGDCYGLSAVRFAVHRLVGVVPAKTILVTASSVYSPLQASLHLVDGSGMIGDLHDNADAAQTMWHTPGNPAPQPPAPGLAASPAWIRFDFAQLQQVDQILIWNHNQANMTDRGFRRMKLYASSDGTNWHLLKLPDTFELPRATGSPMCQPTAIPISPSELTFKSVIIAADTVDGNYGSDCYGLSAVRFIVRH